MNVTPRLCGILLWSSLAAGCADAASPPLELLGGPEPLPQVIDGALSPDELGYDLNRFEQNAVVAPFGLGCTGTLVGDRVVVTAGHCVILNFDDVAMNGAEPQVVAPSNQSYKVGPDVVASDCRLQAASVQVHPDFEVLLSQQMILHDFAVVVLEQSVMEQCAGVVPVQLNREPLSDELIGEQLLQGGYGSLDETYNFSSVRYWSLLEVDAIEDDSVTTVDIEQGFPTFGDSGSGVLRRGADGSLRHLGVCSSGSKALGEMDFVRSDNQLSFVDEVVTEASLICGAFDESGTCVDDVAVRCGAQGFSSTDCRDNGGRCDDQDGEAACVCDCDQQPYCESDCSCDQQCPCECDQAQGCDAECACDPACYPDPVEEDDADEGGGCSVTAGHTATLPYGPGLIVAIWLLSRRRRRRREGR